jgi:hypothetical protein
MCDQATTKICDELQTIAIETTVDPSYGEWRNQLESALRNKPAERMERRIDTFVRGRAA